jgi:hypothetical protein
MKQQNISKENENLTIDKSSKMAIPFLGATIAQFAARNFANQALNTITKPIAEKAWETLFGEVTPNDYIAVDFKQIKKATSLVTKVDLDTTLLNDAKNLLQDSLRNFGIGLHSTLEDIKIETMFLGIQECLKAINRLDDKSDPVWIGAYITAVSQFAFLALQTLNSDSENVKKIIPAKTVADTLNEAIIYVEDERKLRGIKDNVTSKFGEVKTHGSSGYYGFKYFHNGTANTLVNRSESSLILIREELLSTALNVVFAEIIQPDVVRNWRLIIDQVSPK